MKKIICASLFLLAAAIPASAGHTGLYSQPTANCVAPIVSLYWHDKYYAVIFLGIHKRKMENGRPTTGALKTNACWLGRASAALGIPHRKLYTPKESWAILQWFKAHTGTVVTGTVTGTTATN